MSEHPAASVNPNGPLYLIVVCVAALIGAGLAFVSAHSEGFAGMGILIMLHIGLAGTVVLGLLLSIFKAVRTFAASMLCLAFGVGLGYWASIALMGG